MDIGSEVGPAADEGALRSALEVLRLDGADDISVRTFEEQWRRLARGERGTIPEVELAPVGALTAVTDLARPARASELLDELVVIKLNGGLGTSMGLDGPKSLLEVREGRSFLDLIAEQVLALRAAHGARTPLVLMDSFATRSPSLEALGRHPPLSGDLPADFVQGRAPKLDASTLAPVRWPADPSLEWAPPGHGDLYRALASSGLLALALERGYRWAFVSNADNLGATVDAAILEWFAHAGAPLVMEVAQRTPADRKGGHLARRRDRLVLRESAQIDPSDASAAADIERYRWFNTNSLWLDLVRLAGSLDAGGGVLPLPLIVNRKTVDPRDLSSPPVVQLETAMGAAIEVLDGSSAVAVERSRFSPVKTTADLLALRSDAYEIGPDRSVRLEAARSAPPVVVLDPDHQRTVAQLEATFPGGPPSLRRCDRLTVRGPVTFGAGVVVVGDVEVDAESFPGGVPDGTVLEGSAVGGGPG